MSERMLPVMMMLWCSDILQISIYFSVLDRQVNFNLILVFSYNINFG